MPGHIATYIAGVQAEEDFIKREKFIAASVTMITHIVQQKLKLPQQPRKA